MAGTTKKNTFSECILTSLALTFSLGVSGLRADDGIDIDPDDRVRPAQGGGAENIHVSAPGFSVLNTQLVSGTSGIALKCASTLTPGTHSDSETQFRVTRTSVSYSDQGLLLDDDAQDAHLAGALEMALKALTESDPGIFQVIEDGCTALVVSGASQIKVTLYSPDEPVHPLVEVIVPGEDCAQVRIISDELACAVQEYSESEKSVFTKKLNIVGVLATHQETIPDLALSYLKDIIRGFKNKGLYSTLLKPGLVGEAAWAQVDDYQRRMAEEVTVSEFIPAQPKFLGALPIPFTGSMGLCYYEGLDVPPDVIVNENIGMGMGELIGEIIDNAQRFNNGFGRKNHHILPDVHIVDAKDIRFVVTPETAERFHSKQGFRIKDHQTFKILEEATINATDKSLKGFIEDHIVANNKLDRNIKVPRKIPRERTIEDIAHANVRAFAASAIVGGGISAGVHVYDRYRRSGELPHKYTKDELVKLASGIVGDGLRHGASGVVTFNVMTATGLPAPVVGVGMGTVNSLYNSYQAGSLTWENAAPITVRSGVESLVAGTAGWMGKSAASLLVPWAGRTAPVQIGGALAGSLAGRYVYQYVIDRYGYALPGVLSDQSETVLQVH